MSPHAQYDPVEVNGAITLVTPRQQHEPSLGLRTDVDFIYSVVFNGLAHEVLGIDGQLNRKLATVFVL
jgi:hypothetical protein